MPQAAAELRDVPARHPGELVGIDSKSFGSLERGGGRRAERHRPQGRGVGWQHLHPAIEMASRLVFSEFKPTLGGAAGPSPGTRLTNGRAERFIGTIQREWASRDQCTSAAERGLSIALFIPWYNTRRPHLAIGGLTPQGWLDRWWGVTPVYADLS